MHSLQYLVCSHNLLEKVPDSLYTLPNLHTLRLDSNRLQLLTDSVVMATSLTDLDVSHNPMLCLPPEISQCEDLVRIKTVHSGHRSNTQNLSGYWSKMHSTMKLVPMVCKSGTRIDYQECRPKTTSYQPVPISLGQSQTTRPSTRASTCIRASSLSVQHESESTENPRLGIMATFGNPAKVDTVYSPPPLSVRPPQTPFSCARTEATCRFSGAYHESDSIWAAYYTLPEFSRFVEVIHGMLRGWVDYVDVSTVQWKDQRTPDTSSSFKEWRKNSFGSAIKKWDVETTDNTSLTRSCHPQELRSLDASPLRD